MGREVRQSAGSRRGRVVKEGQGNVFGGAPRNLPEAQLPTNKDVGLQVQELEEYEGLSRDKSIARTVQKVEKLYRKASIPTIAKTSIVRKVKKLMEMKRAKENAELIDKRSGKKRDQGTHRKKKKNHKVKDKIEDIKDKIFDVKSEVPELEKVFYKDQCEGRKMYIGEVDKEETDRLDKEAVKLQKRDIWLGIEKERRSRLMEKEDRDKKIYERVNYKDNDEHIVMEEKEKDEGFTLLGKRKFDLRVTKTQKRRKRMSGKDKEFLEEFFETCERFKVTETGASTLFNLNNNDTKLNQSQINKHKRMFRLKKVKEFKPQEEPEAIGFDERKDYTKVEVGKGSKGTKKYEIRKEEHCAVIIYPGEEFAGHVVPGDGTGAGLARDLVAFANERGIKMEKVQYLVSDGCEKMVGWMTGVHATMEGIMMKTYQRVICYFHHLEKGFEVVLLLYSGHSTSPGIYKDGVGKDVKVDVHKLPVKGFMVLPNNSLLLLLDKISSKTFRKLSNDHQIFIGLVRMVITGEMKERWVSRKIGPVVASRFTTTQARCLRLWISQDNPSFGLSRVVHYLIYVWAEVFLLSRHKNLLVEAPRLLLLEVMLTKRYCSMPEQLLLETSISFNGQMGHHESILLAMLASLGSGKKGQGSGALPLASGPSR